METSGTKRHALSALPYRPEIDGLRAVAILAVLIYHINPDWLPGGFVGVDIFFVISGFLITSIILRETTTGVFSFRRFYGRRIKRLFPAMALVLLAVLTYQGIFEPFNYDMARRTGIWVLGLAGNIYVWMATGDYFNPAVANPLLHTWSLGVEEQFYLSFPLILFLISRKGPRPVLPILGILTTVSLIWCIHTTGTKPLDGFYLLPSRAWELLVGCMLAATVSEYKQVFQHTRFAGKLTALGGALICTSYFTLNSGSDFPGWRALLPALGAALVLGFADVAPSMILTFLRSRVMVHIGKISYSLYLWHWPVILAVQGLGESPLAPPWIPSWVTPCGALALSFFLASGSYKYVESPLRLWRWTPLVSVGVGAVLLLGMVVVKQNNLIKRYQFVGASPFEAVTERGWIFEPGIRVVPEKYRSLANQLADPADLMVNGVTKMYGSNVVDVMVFGDSHAVRLAPMIDDLLRARRLSGKFFCYSGQKPESLVPGQDSQRRLTTDRMQKFKEEERRVVSSENLGAVLWVSRYDDRTYAEVSKSVGFVLEHTFCVFVQQPPILNIGDGLSTVDQFSYYKLVHGLRPDNLNIREKKTDWCKRKAIEAKLLAEFGNRRNFIYVATEDVFLRPGGRVRWWDGISKPYYIDDDHLSGFGAELLQAKLAEALEKALRKKF